MRNIGTIEELKKNNHIVLDIKCANVTEVSENCAVSKSHIIFECRKGTKFANNQESKIFKSVCTKKGWTRAPRCIAGYLFLIYQLINMINCLKKN